MVFTACSLLSVFCTRGSPAYLLTFNNNIVYILLLLTFVKYHFVSVKLSIAYVTTVTYPMVFILDHLLVGDFSYVI